MNYLKKQCRRYWQTKRDAIDSLHRYIMTNEERMRYDVFRPKGYDIGSGAVGVRVNMWLVNALSSLE
ncbi:MAG: hypothetical protein NTW55_02685 [Planctomycetota bacterium]|nr:hypothetical protein [Planctomycetota bacterium]